VVMQLCIPPGSAGMLASTGNYNCICVQTAGTMSWSLWQETSDMFRLLMQRKWTITARHIGGVLMYWRTGCPDRDRFCLRDGAYIRRQPTCCSRNGEQTWWTCLPPGTTRNANICVPISGPTDRGDRRTEHQLGRHVRLCLPPSGNPEEGASEIVQTKTLRLILVTLLWSKQA